MAKQLITVPLETGVSFEVEAFIYGKPPVFAAHPTISGNPPTAIGESNEYGWCVTHLQSGARLGYPTAILRYPLKQRQAQRLARELAAGDLAVWDISRNEFKDKDKLAPAFEAYKLALSRLGL